MAGRVKRKRGVPTAEAQLRVDLEQVKVKDADKEPGKPDLAATPCSVAAVSDGGTMHVSARRRGR